MLEHFPIVLKCLSNLCYNCTCLYSALVQFGIQPSICLINNNQKNLLDQFMVFWGSAQLYCLYLQGEIFWYKGMLTWLGGKECVDLMEKL
jgi:hypothetical protein